MKIGINSNDRDNRSQNRNDIEMATTMVIAMSDQKWIDMHFLGSKLYEFKFNKFAKHRKIKQFILLQILITPSMGKEHSIEKK